MTSPTHTLLTRVLDSLKHLHTLHGPCTPSGDGKTCPHAAVIAELEITLFTKPNPPLGETFTDSQIGSALMAFLKYGEETFVGEDEPKQFGQRGYFSGEGWAARCLRYHLFQMEGERALRDLQNSLKTGNHDPRSNYDPLFQAVAPPDGGSVFPCDPAPPLSHDPHDLSAALLQAMAGGATISTSVTEDVPSTIPVTRRLVVTRHGQHWEDIQ